MAPFDFGFPGRCMRRPLENSYIRAEDSSPEFNKTSVDGSSIWANLLIPLEAGLLWFGSAFYVHPGTANWKLNFVPVYTVPLSGADQNRKTGLGFLLSWTRDVRRAAGSLKSTYRVVRKYNFKS